jgi:RNA polymerase sigma factor (sigma-70 family)
MSLRSDIRDPFEDLLALCKKNDRKAQIKVYELLSKKMYNTSIRIVKNSMVAEDAVQESFITVFKSLGKFRGEVPFENWLRRIVINKSIDQLRKEKMYLNNDLHELDYADSDKTNFNLELEENENIIDKLKKQINILPEGYRIIFNLYYFEGYDHEEIGQILNISPSTSRSQLTRAKEKLVKQLKKINVTE